MTQGLYMYILMFWQNKHIHEIETHINPKNMNTSLKCMDHQN